MRVRIGVKLGLYAYYEDAVVELCTTSRARIEYPGFVSLEACLIRLEYVVGSALGSNMW